jgi:hypothetical protein
VYRPIDLAWPSPVDWEAVNGDLFFAGGNDSRLVQEQLSWDARRDVAVFRGSSTGGGVTHEDNQRIALCSIVQDHVDAGITRRIERDFLCKDGVVRFQKEQSLQFRDSMPESEWGKVKAVINVEGHAATERLSRILQSGAVMIWLEPSNEARHTYLSDELKPWVHFVPATSCRDVGEKMKWILSHPKESQQIAANAKALWERRCTYRALLDTVMQNIRKVAAWAGTVVQRQGDRDIYFATTTLYRHIPLALNKRLNGHGIRPPVPKEKESSRWGPPTTVPKPAPVHEVKVVHRHYRGYGHRRS